MANSGLARVALAIAAVLGAPAVAVAEAPPVPVRAVAAGPTVLPLPLLEGRAATLDVRVAGERPERVRASQGTLEPARAGGDGFTLRFARPKPAMPGVALVEIEQPACRVTWALLPIAGPATVELRTKPRSAVRLTIADRVYGPVRADRAGHAAVPVLLGPGDERYLAHSTDHVGNHSESSATLPPPPGSAAVLASACPVELRAGESALIDVAAIDPRGRPVVPEVTLPAGFSSVSAGAEGPWRRLRLTAGPRISPGPVEVMVRADRAVARVALVVLPPRPGPIVMRSRPVEVSVDTPPPPPPPRRRLMLAADVGFASNAGQALGVDATVGAAYRFAGLGRRVSARLEVSLVDLRGTAGPPQDSADLDALAVPMQAGGGVTVWKPGPVQLDLEASAGAALLRNRYAHAMSTVTNSGVIPSLRGGVALRYRRGRGAAVLRAGWRHLFYDPAMLVGGVVGTEDLMFLSVGGELGVM